jgi:hypothetical protein
MKTIKILEVGDIVRDGDFMKDVFPYDLESVTVINDSLEWRRIDKQGFYDDWIKQTLTEQDCEQWVFIRCPNKELPHGFVEMGE